MTETPARVGVIGASGKGAFGHSMETAFGGLQGASVVAVSSPDSAALQRAQLRSGAAATYTDYNEMLAKERLDVVVVAPRDCTGRSEMIGASVAAGVMGIFSEKPLAATLEEADLIVDRAKAAGVPVAVALRRANAYEAHAKRLIDEGLIGEVRVIRGHGKGDARAGSQDLAILGIHIFDSIRYYADSEVAWVHGHVTQGGHDIGPDDVRDGDEGIGLIAGDGVAAYLAFENGVTAHFDSYEGDRAGGRALGLEIYGTKGILSVRNSPSGELHYYPHGVWLPGTDSGIWERILIPEWEEREDGTSRTKKEKTELSNRLIAEDLLAAMRQGTELQRAPSAADARAAFEAITAVHESQIRGRRVTLPLGFRGNPYARLLDELGVANSRRKE